MLEEVEGTGFAACIIAGMAIRWAVVTGVDSTRDTSMAVWSCSAPLHLADNI